MRALGYFTIEQGPEDGPRGARTLADAFAHYCAQERHQAIAAYHDVDGSEVRPRWKQMVEGIREKGAGYLVVVPHAGHLGAGLEEQVGRVLELDRLNCSVVCADPERPDPLQNALHLLETGSASSRRGERIRQAMRAKAANGLGLGKPPFGYRLLWDGSFAVVPEEAEVVREIFRLYREEDGGGVRAIAQELNRRGLRTRSGRAWSMVTVRDLLRNTAYIGTYRRFGLRIPSTYEALVSPAEFRQVQERMDARSPGRRHAKAEPFLLSGLLYCGHCGQRMLGVVRRQSWQRKGFGRVRGEYRYYQCQSRINQGRCGYRTTRSAPLEEAVLTQVRTLVPEERPVEATDGQGLAAEGLAKADARLRALDRRAVDLVRQAASGASPLAQLRAALVGVEQERRSLRQRQERMASGGEGVRALMEEQRDKLHYLWEDMDVAERQEALRTLVEKVVVKDGAAQVILR
jgi:site-specific DNA recombinase